MDKFILILYLFCVLFSMTPTINTISLYMIVPIMCLTLILHNHKVFYSNNYLSTYLLLIVWMAFTCVTAVNPDVAWRQMVRLLAAYIFSVISFYLASKKAFIKWLYIIIILNFIVLYHRASSAGELIIAQTVADRDQFNGVNANGMAYFLFYATFAIFMLIRSYKKTYLLFAVTVLLLIFSVYLSLLTASRQVLLIQIPLIILLLLVCFFKAKARNIVMLFIGASLIIFVGWPILNDYLNNSLLGGRVMENVLEDARYFLVRDAINEATNHPLLGLGPDNFRIKYRMFTHNTYLELLVSSGFPAMIFFISLITRFIYLQIKRYIKTKDRSFLMFFIFASFFAVDNLFYVFTGDMWLMGPFFIIVGHSELYYKNYIYETKRN